MQITLVTVGRCRDRALNAIADRYAERIAHYGSFEALSVKGESASSKPAAEVIDREGKRLIQTCPANAVVVALDAAGRSFTSESLAARLGDLSLRGQSRICFLIGGAFGLSAEARARADWLLSLSDMTLAHDLARIVLLEQLYRAFTIQRGESYHK